MFSSILCRDGRLLNLNSPVVMAILNITPDSFYTSCTSMGREEVCRKAHAALTEGAALLDLGGYSTRPGAPEVSEAEEMERICNAIHWIREEHPEAILSIDTFRSSVADEAIRCGADIINDVSGGQLDEKMFQTVADAGVPYILMHMRGTPQTMQQLTDYDDLMADLLDFFQKRVYQLQQMGVKDIILDPGFGFAKTMQQNYQLLRDMHILKTLGLPILAGLSHKSMLYKLLGGTAADMGNATTAANMLALANGAQILRVHETKPAVEAIRIFTATMS